MNLLVPDRYPNPTESPARKSMQLVSSAVVRSSPQAASTWLTVFGLVGAFVGGFGLSSFWRPPVVPPEPKIQIVDFRVELPEGQTDVVITSRDGNGKELAHLQVERDGNTVKGLPENLRHIAPREALSSEDATFFRRELNGVYAPSDSEWTKANKIRIWLMRQPHRISMPGLATRIPRQAYTQAKPRGRYVLYARVSVSRGLVTWKLADSSQGAMSMGTIEPERITEVVSDIVESQSGYLDVQFDVPSGGAFRVMDQAVRLG